MMLEEKKKHFFEVPEVVPVLECFMTLKQSKLDFSEVKFLLELDVPRSLINTSFCDGIASGGHYSSEGNFLAHFGYPPDES